MKLVYLSPVPWNSVAQRPHFFVKAALESGFTSVLWVEPTPSRLPLLKDFRTKLFSVEADSFEKPYQIEIEKPKCIPVEPFRLLYDLVNHKTLKNIQEKISDFSSCENAVLVIGKPSRFALRVLDSVLFCKTVFDVMDDFPHFFKGISAKSMEVLHRNVIKKVDICFFSSHNLQSKYRDIANSCELVLNACDKEFNFACKNFDKKKLTGSRVFGYVGSVAEWFDWSVVIKLAQDNPDDHIIIVGPNYSPCIPDLPNNIEIRKAVQHSEIPELLSSFNYALIPFKINGLTDSVDPVKYYEYIAAGLPVISTGFGEMKHRISQDKAVTFEQFQSGKVPISERPVFWMDRFGKFLSDFMSEKKN